MVWVHLLVWSLALVGVALWSLVVWLLAHLVGLGAEANPRFVEWLAVLPGAGLLDDLLPGWRDLAHALAELARTLFGWLDASLPWWPWLLWGAGAACVLLLAIGLSLGLHLLAPRSRKAIAPTVG